MKSILMILGILCSLSNFFLFSQLLNDELEWTTLEDSVDLSDLHLAIPVNPFIGNIESESSTTTEGRFELVKLSDSYTLQVNSPKGNEIDNEVSLHLEGEQSKLLFSLENIYNLSANSDQEITQLIEVFGLNNSGETIFPTFFFNEIEEGHHQITGNQIEVLQPEMNDIMVFFDQAVSVIHVNNKKSVASNQFRSFFSIGSFRKIPPEFNTNFSNDLTDRFCSVNEVVFILDASTSMNKPARTETINGINKTLKAFYLKNNGKKKFEVSVYSFSNTINKLISKVVIEEKADIYKIQLILKENYLPISDYNKGWTNWSSLSEYMSPANKKLSIIFCNGLSNGNTEKRTTHVKAFDVQNLLNGPIIVDMSDNGMSEKFRHFDSGSYLTFIDELDFYCNNSNGNQAEVSVFPNPFSIGFIINFSGGLPENIHLSLTNQMGQTVYSQTILRPQANIFIPAQNLVPGLYKLDISDLENNLIFEEKLIKQ